MGPSAEPSQLEERASIQLPPRSYAAAVDPDVTPGRDGADGDGSVSSDELTGGELNDGCLGSSRERERSFGPQVNRTADDGKAVVFQKYGEGEQNGLASVKPTDDYETALRHGDKGRPRPHQAGERGELVSGRRAGSGWERSGIRWAPLNVPLKRRLQTLTVLLHTLSIVLSLTIFFFLCAIPLLWPIIVPYLIYILFSRAGVDGSLALRSERFRRSPVWSLFASYFPARLHRSAELPPTRKYIFGYHPHGIISHGAFAAFATEALGFGQLFPGITNTLLTLDSNFRIPLYRDYALRMGVASVSRESCENILSRGGPNGEGMGRAITIVVGGARESLDAHPHSLRLVLRSRKGFVKLAVRTGADLVPVLAFGENELYDQYRAIEHPRIHQAQLFVKKLLGFTIPLFHARGVFNYDVGMMPYRRPINVVVGRPITVQKKERPEEAYIDELHTRYVSELKKIWDDWKDIFAKERVTEMEIVD
ncbi:diacylglycerol acyltransferase-domain-containing protein [Lineolata rhizophorae]|uniref:Diacylglycerol O-acyltransferase n=1 Tax=Lineolata rhizophorae TaxID=578093 RepID=A0A6A6NYH5_9PEZI|nr:diacylglycerol acyltransferase-domain-containing protein [Lineolata rhizophorae]